MSSQPIKPGNERGDKPPDEGQLLAGDGLAELDESTIGQADDVEGRLIAAAGPIFAEHGFEGATVRQICKASGANLNAINYYFGDKLGLYRAVVSHGYGQVIGSRSGQVGPGMPEPRANPRGAIVAFVTQMVHRVLVPSGQAMDEAVTSGARQQGGRPIGKPAWLHAIMMREMVSPTPSGPIEVLVEQFIRPEHMYLRTAVATLMGIDPGDDRVTRGCYSIVSQILFYEHCKHVITKLAPIDVSHSAQRAELARHVATFALGGIEASARAVGEADRSDVDRRSR